MTYGKSMQCSKYSTPKKHVYRYMCIDICKLTNKVTLKKCETKSKTIIYVEKFDITLQQKQNTLQNTCMYYRSRYEIDWENLNNKKYDTIRFETIARKNTTCIMTKYDEAKQKNILNKVKYSIAKISKVRKTRNNKVTEGNLDIKLPTICKDEKQGWEWSEQRREEERRSKAKKLSEETRSRCAKM